MPFRVRLVAIAGALLVAMTALASTAGASGSPSSTTSSRQTVVATAPATNHLASHAGGDAATTTTTPEPISPWRGTEPPCLVQLPAPDGLKVYGTYYTCPPKRVLIIGDSVALTMGIEADLQETNWGVVLDDQALLGCGFLTGMEINADGTFVEENPACASELSTWKQQVESFNPNVIVVEMGWWDSMQHLHDGQVVELGQSWYDATLLAAMEGLVKALDVDGGPPIDFMTVPWMDPPKFPNGETNPGATAAFHDDINNLLAQAVKATQPRTRLFDVSPYVTPANKYEEVVDGGQCRESDGVHMYYGVGLDYVLTPCGESLQAGLYTTIREQLNS